MRLNLQTDFALRVLMVLAQRPEPAPTVRGLSEALDISNNHLMKIVGELRAAGWIKARRGRQGGLFLNVEPETLNLRDIVEWYEGGHALVDCFRGDATCTLLPGCRLKGVLHKALIAFYTELGSKTLADISGAQKPT